MAGRVASLIFVGAVLLGAGSPPPDAAITNGRLRVLLPSRPAAGYFDLQNRGDQPIVLNGASSPGCGMLMLHRSVATGGTDRMEMVPDLTVAPHEAVHFAPGGYHLMCMQPKPDLKRGGTVPVTLEFEDGSHITTTFSVGGADVR